VERNETGKEEARAVFQGGDSPHKHESLLVLLTSFPRCLGEGVFELPRLVGDELLEVLEDDFNPLVGLSSPLLAGQS